MFYYNKKLPQLNDIVFVTIKSFSKNGAYCNLIEYNNIEGLILNTELDRRIKHANRQFTFNNIYPLLVISVFGDKIDLSYRKINPEERSNYLEQFGYIEKVRQFVRECIYITKLDEETVYSLTMWKFFKNSNYLTDAKNIYMTIIKNPLMFMFHAGGKFNEQFMEYIENMKNRIETKIIIIGQNFELFICDEEAIYKLKNLLSYKSNNTEIKYIASPRYQLIISGDEEFCDNEIKKFNEYMNKNISNYQKCIFKMLDKSTIKEQHYSFKKIKID